MTSFTCEALGRLFPAPIFPGPLALRVSSADQQLWAPRTRATPSPRPPGAGPCVPLAPRAAARTVGFPQSCSGARW